MRGVGPALAFRYLLLYVATQQRARRKAGDGASSTAEGAQEPGIMLREPLHAAATCAPTNTAKRALGWRYGRVTCWVGMGIMGTEPPKLASICVALVVCQSSLPCLLTVKIPTLPKFHNHSRVTLRGTCTPRAKQMAPSAGTHRHRDSGLGLRSYCRTRSGGHCDSGFSEVCATHTSYSR